MKALLTALYIVLFVSMAVAKPVGKKANKKPQEKSNRVTEANFSGSTVAGQYAHSPEMEVAVEDEKKLISVVKPRDTFKFQVKKSQEDYK